MPQSKQFKQNLNYGGRGEDRAEEILKPYFPTVRNKNKEIEGVFKDYDLIDDNGVTFEVKTDTTSKKTGNVAIEFESWGKPSGIARTKASLWFHMYWDGSNWVWTCCSVDLLRNYIELKKPVKRQGGEENKSWMYLVNAGQFAKKFGCEKIVKN